MARTFHILSGPPGSGKTTFSRTFLENDFTIVFSRDAYRDCLRQQLNSTNYFPTSAVEEYEGWINTVLEGIREVHPYYNVVIDQTNCSIGSISKLLRNLAPLIDAGDTLHFHHFTTHVEECISRNTLREGFNKVPDEVIKSLYNVCTKVYTEPYTELAELVSKYCGNFIVTPEGGK